MMVHLQDEEHDLRNKRYTLALKSQDQCCHILFFENKLRENPSPFAPKLSDSTSMRQFFQREGPKEHHVKPHSVLFQLYVERKPLGPGHWQQGLGSWVVVVVSMGRLEQVWPSPLRTLEMLHAHCLQGPMLPLYVPRPLKFQWSVWRLAWPLIEWPSKSHLLHHYQLACPPYSWILPLQPHIVVPAHAHVLLLGKAVPSR